MKQIVDAQNSIVDENIDGQPKNGHGVVLVGYERDDRIAGGGCFILRNSWGPQFGEGGYAKATFEFARKYGTDA